MKILNEYPNSHHYIEEYSLTNYFCPGCSKQSVWQASSGDYYVGPDCICTDCGNCFHIIASDPSNSRSKVEQLVTGKMSIPTTPRGT